MKKWFKFFGFSFFSHKISKDGRRHGYVTTFLGFILALVFLWLGFVGGDMLPFGAHYNNSTDFQNTVHTVFANPDISKRICVEVEDGVLKAKKHNGEYSQGVLINTFENDSDKQIYSSRGYDVVIDSRPATTLAEIEAYCVSNDGKNLKISYQEYLNLSDVAKLNFDFKLNYTGNALELDDETVKSYRDFVVGSSDENKLEIEALDNDLKESRITKSEYNRALYELYFASYYPAITDYENSSKVPLLRNYYYHKYISEGVTNYLLIFDDYMVASFETDSGINVSFYGFYTDFANGTLISDDADTSVAKTWADEFIKKSFNSIGFLNLYAYAINVFSLIPFIALMPMVVTLLAYSLLKLRGVESITSLGTMFKIIGSYSWVSSLISAILTVGIAFFVQRNMITAMPLVLFFIILAVRSIIFAVFETKLYIKQSEQEKTEQMEV